MIALFLTGTLIGYAVIGISSAFIVSYLTRNLRPIMVNGEEFGNFERSPEDRKRIWVGTALFFWPFLPIMFIFHWLGKVGAMNTNKVIDWFIE